MSERYRVISSSEAELAERLIESSEYRDVIFAALLLRRSLEALVFRIAIGFRDEFGAEELRTWQAPKLLEVLLEIDPFADMNLIMKIKNKDTGEWIELGSTARISLKKLKSHYYSLGSLIHVPTIHQIERKKDFNEEKAKEICRECLADINKSLNSSLEFNHFAIFGSIEFTCEKCKNHISKRLNALEHSKFDRKRKSSIIARCTSCVASYEIRRDPEDRESVLIRPQIWSHKCPKKDCDGTITAWQREAIVGMEATCSRCSERSVMVSAIAVILSKDLQRFGGG
jgi:hypothetical protein